MNLSRSTAVFAVRLLLSVAVVYRFSHAENKSIFAQRYGPCTPPEGTKHTNVRRAKTKYKTIVKDTHDPLISCGFSTLAPLAEMRYTENTKTNAKEKLPQAKPDGFASSLGEGASGATGNVVLQPETLPLCQRPHLRGGCHGAAVTGGVSSTMRPLRLCFANPPLPKGEARAQPETFSLNLIL